MKARLPRAGLLYVLIALASFGAVGLALVSQHRFGMQPCPWCVLQRLIFVVIGALAAVGALGGGRVLRTLMGGLIVLLAAGGIAAALWQHFVAARSSSCDLTLADHIVSGLKLDASFPEVFEVRASCADAATTLLGISYDFWSLALFAVLAGLAVVAVRCRR